MYGFNSRMTTRRDDMPQHNCSVQLRFAATAWLFFAPIAAAPTGVLAAGYDKQDLIGDWRGTTTDRHENSQINVSVDMQITAVKINEKGGRFHFGPPRSCEMALIYKDVGPNDSSQFYLVESHGGFCDRLNNALLTLSFQGSDLNFVISPIGKFVGEHGVLKKE
jgi:hypothetical protein